MKGRSLAERMESLTVLLDDIIDSDECSTQEALDIMEEAQSEVESRIDGLKSDLEAQQG